jgi:hypothetical protein
MWRLIRIGALLFILAVVAKSACVDRSRNAEWENELAGRDLPVGADSSTTSGRYVSACARPLSIRSKRSLRSRARGTAFRCRIRGGLSRTRDIVAASRCPVRRQPVSIAFWSLQLRAWAWWNDSHKGPKPDVRLFVVYHDPAASPRLPHSTASRKA